MRIAAPFIMLLVAASFTIPAMLVSDYMKSRWLDLGASVVSRTDHWSSSVALLPDTIAASLIGAGLGSFPSLYQSALLPDERAPAVVWRKDSDDTFLRVGRGRPLYIDQSVELRPFEEYDVRVRVRSERGVTVKVLACRKHLLNSAGCSEVALSSPPAHEWQELAGTINSGVVGIDDELTGLRAPAVLTLMVSITDAVLDISSVELYSASGIQLIRNSGFRDRLEHWSYTQDDHLLWQAKNLWVQVYVELGLAGCVLLTLVLTGSAIRLLNTKSVPLDVRLALVGSLVAVGVMAVSDSIINAPRAILLVMLVLQVSLSLTYQSGLRSQRHSGC